MSKEEWVENIYLYFIIFLLSGVFFTVLGIISNVRLFVFFGEVVITGGVFGIIVNLILSRYTTYTFGRQLGIQPKETLLAGISRVVSKRKFIILKRDIEWQLIASQRSSECWSAKRLDNMTLLIVEEDIDGVVFERAATASDGRELPLPIIEVKDMINDIISKPVISDIPEFSWPGRKKYKIKYIFKAKGSYIIKQVIEYPPCNDPSKDDFVAIEVLGDTLSTKLSITFQGIELNNKYFFEAYIEDDMHVRYKDFKVTPPSNNKVIVEEPGYDGLIGFTRKGDFILFWHKPLEHQLVTSSN